jgi:hypothetical protein
MLTKWFATRSTRSLKNDRPFRPCLESLEERNAPSGFGPGEDHGGGHGHHHGPPPPPSPSVNTSVSTASNAHGSFNNSTFTNSFNTTITNTITVNLMPGQTAAVQGLMGFTNLLATLANSPQLGTLFTDEIIAAVDTYLTTPAISTALGLSSTEVDTLTTDLNDLKTAIAGITNTDPILSAFGTEVFLMTLNALTSPQNVI